MKKTLILLLAVLFALPTLMSARIVYLKPNANWIQDNARFAVYLFNPVDPSSNSEAWIDMTDEDGDGYYSFDFNDDYSSMIFCRMNPNTAENNWKNKWNQTSDLTVSDQNCYNVEENTWDKGNGYWSMYNALFVTVTDAQYSTLFADYAVSIPEGVTAYTGAVNNDATVLNLTKVEGNVLPKQTPVVLHANAGKYLFLRVDEIPALTGENSLKGNWVEAPRPEGMEIFTLQKIDNKVGFYKYLGEKMQSNRAYLAFPSNTNVSSLSIQFGDITGIEDAVEANHGVQKMYDLQGREVTKATHAGVYIVNGKKVFVK